MKQLIALSVATIIVTTSSMAYSFPSIPKFGKKKAEAAALEQEKVRAQNGGFDAIVIPAKNTKGKFAKKPYPDVTGDTRKWAGPTKVMVPMYKVSFDKKAGASAKASTGWTGPNANAHVHAHLEGVDEATFARITNAASTDFAAKLAAAGYEVVSPETLATSQKHQSWNGSKFPKAGKGKSTYLADGTRYPGKITYGLKWGSLMNEMQAAILQPDFAVNFATFGTESYSGFGTASASVSLGPVVHVQGIVNGSTLNKCDKRGQCYGDLIYLSFGQPPFSETPFARIADTTSGAVKTIQTVTNILSKMQGTSTRSDSKKTFTADAQAYEKAALDALFKANTAMIDKLNARDKS